MESLQDDIAEWKQEFLNKAALTGRVSFAPLLKEAGDFWKQCRDLYGEGKGYRMNISDIFLKFFEEDPSALETAVKVESSLAEIWGDVVINPLMKAANYEPA